MFEKLLGVSKKTFLEKNVVRASDNDRFNDNKCTFCWGTYDENHRAVRVRSCDHVFGQECLHEMINAPNGDHCPICRSSWFQPPLGLLIEHKLLDHITHRGLWLTLAFHNPTAFWRRLPTVVKLPFRCWYYMSNMAYQIDFLLWRFTSVYARNPSLNLEDSILSFQVTQHILLIAKVLSALCLVFLLKGVRSAPLYELWHIGPAASTVITAIFVCGTGKNFQLGSKRDRAIVALMAVLVLVFHLCMTQRAGWLVIEEGGFPKIW